MYFEDVLFLIFINRTEHLQAIDLSLSEQGYKSALIFYKVEIISTFSNKNLL